jgi:hypothetical protein
LNEWRECKEEEAVGTSSETKWRPGEVTVKNFGREALQKTAQRATTELK